MLQCVVVRLKSSRGPEGVENFPGAIFRRVARDAAGPNRAVSRAASRRFAPRRAVSRRIAPFRAAASRPVKRFHCIASRRVAPFRAESTARQLYVSI